MNIHYSKHFIKAAKQLTGKPLESLRQTIQEVKLAQQLSDITDCKKLINFNNTYRIRIGKYRAFFTFYITIEDNVVCFQYLMPRGQAYTKEMQKKLRQHDKNE